MYPHRSLRRARELPWGTAFEAALAKNAISISKVDKPRPAAELQACLSDQGKTMRHLIAPLCLALLIVWVDGLDGVVIPYSHPANPYARSAPPIVVPRIQAPNVKDVTPEPAREDTRPPRQQQPSHPGPAAPAHQHQH
jgi:hypothetical protein